MSRRPRAAPSAWLTGQQGASLGLLVCVPGRWVHPHWLHRWCELAARHWNQTEIKLQIYSYLGSVLAYFLGVLSAVAHDQGHAGCGGDRPSAGASKQQQLRQQQRERARPGVAAVRSSRSRGR